jgi:CheY-like chemotaxis protein
MSEITVLLAEDNEGIALLTKKALRRNININQIIHFQNGREILDFLFSCQHIDKGDIILMLDIQMPFVSGIEVLKEIRNQDDLKSLPVVIFSSISDPKVVNLCDRLGCNVFLPKPTNYSGFEDISKLDFSSMMRVPKIAPDIFYKSAS